MANYSARDTLNLANGRYASAVTPNDSTTFDNEGMLYVGTGGDVTVDLIGSGTNLTFSNVPDGVFLPITVSRVYSTGTTASDIVLLYRG